MRSAGDRTRHLLLIPFAPGVGDMVMMEPLLRAVRAATPEWRLTMVAREYAADLIQPGQCEFVSPFYFVTRTPAALRPLHRLIPQPLIAWAAEPALSLDLGPFDRVINLFWVWENRTPFDRWWTPRWPPQTGVRHTIDLLAEYLEEELGASIPMALRAPRLRVFPAAAAWAKLYLHAVRAPEQCLVPMVVSASNALKLWDVRKWAELNGRLRERGWQTLLIAPHDDRYAREVYRVCRGKPPWPKLGLRQMAALLELSDVVVGIDTGPLHVAAAVGAPWIGLFGPTHPDLIGPYDRSRGQALVARFPKPESCKACWRAFKNREERCATLPSTGCATLITVEEVLAAIDGVRDGTRIA